MKGIQTILSILFLLFAFTGIQAQEKFKIQDPEKHLSKKEKQILENAVHYEAAFYDRIFPGKKTDFSDIKFTIIPDQLSFAMYVKNLVGVYLNNISGIYFLSAHELVVCTDKKFKESFIRTLCHEVSHAFLHLHSDDKIIPAWLNEGLAVYLQRMSYDKKKITQRMDHRYAARVKTLIELKDLDLADFVTWDYRKFSVESFSQENNGYAIGYCIVFFLMQYDEENAIIIFRNLFGKQTSKAVFDNCYPGGFAQFEKDFMEYWSK